MKPIFDAHLDLAWSALHWNRDLTISLAEMRAAEANMIDHVARGRATVTLPELQKAGVRVCLGTVLIRSKPEVCPAEGFSRRDLDYRNQTLAGAVGWGQLTYYEMLAEAGQIRLLKTSAELTSHFEGGSSAERPLLGVILAMEGADPILTPQHAEVWWQRGLRCVSLSHYAQGPYAPGTTTTGPLTAMGVELLQEFERLGMIVDLTHCAEPAFFEVLERFPGAVLASHNMVRALVPGDRQFSDDQIRALLDRNAVIGMALDAWMLTPHWNRDGSARDSVALSAVCDHIDHICQLAGKHNHVGIGSDLDGGFGTEQTPHDLDSIADLQKLDRMLEQRGYDNDARDAIFHGNFMRLFREALP